MTSSGASRLYNDLSSLLSIRLLTINPDKATAEVQCELTEVEFSQAPPYEALSYVWGNEEPLTEVKCNGFVVAVRPNLAAALRQIRHEDESRVVWIDALCINQSDLRERSHQVSFMQDIYQRAKKVLMWLGNDDDGSVGAALGLIDEAVKYARQETRTLIPRPEEIKVELPSIENNESRGFPPSGDSSWKALVRLFQRPYFERVWILQEVYQAASAQVMIGSHRTDWTQIGVAVHWFVQKGYAGMIPGFICLMKVFMLWGLTVEKSYKEPPGPIADLLCSQANLVKATDPRDKVYALRGLSNDILQPEKAAALYPDYTKTVADVYIDTVRYLLENPQPGHNQKLGFLTIGHSITDDDEEFQTALEVANGDEKEITRLKADKELGLPSWVPRWNSDRFTWFFSRIPEAKAFCASKDTNASYVIKKSTQNVKDEPTSNMSKEVDQSGYSLFLRGLQIDDIETSGDYFRGLSGNVNRLKLWNKVKELWVSAVIPLERSGRYLNREHLTSAFAEALTVSADINMAGLVRVFNASDFTAYCRDSLESETKDMIIEEKQAYLAAFPMPVPTASLKGDPELFARSICTTKPFFTTHWGFVGRGHQPVQAGYKLCIFYGAITPHVVRPVAEYHTFMGDCYVPGLMFGEAMDWNREGGWTELR